MTAAFSASSNAASGSAWRLASAAVSWPVARAKRFGIGARLRERQIDQLKHRFQIATQRPATEPSNISSMSGRTNAVLPASFLLKSIATERAEAAFGDNLIRGFRRNVVLIAGERRAAGAERRGTGSRPA